jgi:hypothetical protein
MGRDAGEDKGVETTAAQWFRSTLIFMRFHEVFLGNRHVM